MSKYLAWIDELENELLCSCVSWLAEAIWEVAAPEDADTPTGAGAVLGRCLQRWRLKWGCYSINQFNHLIRYVEISSLVTLMWIFIGINAINSGHTMAYNLMVRMYDVIHLKLQYKPFLEENVNFTYFYFKLFSFLSRHKTTWIEGSKTTNLLNMMFDVWPWTMCWVIKWVVLGKFKYC